MRVAVISDIHANLPALNAVLADVEKSGADEIWCLGDAVGYGARPRQCLELLLDRCEICLSGNHDLAATGKIDISVFSPGAARAAIWTREELGNEGLALLEQLGGSSSEREGIGVYHASPRDPVWEYVVDSELAADNIGFQPQRISLIGHSHLALYFTRVDETSRVSAVLAPEGTERDLEFGKWLINPGSVGQPRDGDPRAAWALLDLDSSRVEFRRTGYPVAEAAAAILDAGLPPELADRLFEGR
ncbi:MAG: metallophosphatase family protein [Solirubrobacterales bacterium]|nr:metallophosphatase family protein [Solirubrobacterales bacterium]